MSVLKVLFIKEVILITL